MEYSKISKLYVKNFKNLSMVTIDFTKSPIIALKGNNDAGKSSVIDAFAVATYNAYEAHQKDFIKLGTNGFGVQIELEDGTSVIRIKKQNLNYYEVKYPDGRSWSTDKLIRGEDVPTAVMEVMGCVKEPETKEFLHIRTYNDQMLFITTPNSVNYKVMYDALKVENISRAIKKGSVEANEIKAWLNRASIQREALVRSLEGIQIKDIEPVVSCRNRLLKSQDRVKKLVRAKELIDSINKLENQLGAYKELYSSGIEEVNVNKVRILDSLRRHSDAVTKLQTDCSLYSGINQIGLIDTGIVCKLEQLSKTSETERVYLNQLDELKELSELQSISVQRLGILSDAEEFLNSLQEQKSRLSTYHELDNISDIVITQSIEKLSKGSKLVGLHSEYAEQLESINNNIKVIKDELKAMGAKVITCDNCGNDIITFDNDLGGVSGE